MTAINTIRQRQAVHIISDGAFFNKDGILLEIGPNAFPLPHFPAALAIRGATHLMPFLIHRICRDCVSFDELLLKIVSMVLEVHMSFPMMLGTVGFGTVAPDFDLVVAGWSASRSKPESYVVTSQRPDRQTHVENGYGLVDLPDVLIVPSVNELQIEAAGWIPPKSAEAFRPEHDGLKLLQAQRLAPKFPSKEPGINRAAVGGFAQLTSISQRKVQIEILHRWSDQVGRKVG